MAATQADFRTALLDPKTPEPAGLQDGDGNPAHKRFDVYRNNVTVALIEAVRAAFPVLLKLLGPQNFDQLAQLFVRTYPPKSPLMMHYGAEMPAFLTDFAPFKHIGYLPDVARLELALRRSYHASDPPPFDATVLGTMVPDTFMASTLALAPAVEFVPSDWPLADIWCYNTQKNADKPRAIAQPTLITRAEFDPAPAALSLDQAAWIAAIMHGQTIMAAHAAACAKNPNFDLTPVLTLLIQTNSICEVKPPKE